MKNTMTQTNKEGKVAQVIGPVVDVIFDGQLPAIYTALEVQNDKQLLVLEVQQHLTGNIARSVALGSTDGLRRGMTAVNTGKPISVPVGKETLGRMFDVLGAPLDGQAAV